MKSWCRHFVHALIILGATLLALSSAYAQSDVVREMELYWGAPALTRAHATSLYSLFLDPVAPGEPSIMEALERAQNQLFDNDKALTINDFVILDSPRDIVFVMMTPGGGQVSANTVFISTGMLAEHLGLKVRSPNPKFNEAELIRVMPEIIGKLAHEMAHPLDRVNVNSVEKRFGRKTQAIELKTDIMGAQIAGIAGFLMEGGYNALVRLKKKITYTLTAYEAYTESHPDIDVRLTALEAFLAAYRYEHGRLPEKDLSPLGKLAPGIVGDISTFRSELLAEFFKVQRHASFEVALDTLERTMKAFEAKRNKEQLTELEVLHFNQLWIELLGYLKDPTDRPKRLGLLHKKSVPLLVAHNLLEPAALQGMAQSLGVNPEIALFQSPMHFINGAPEFTTPEYIEDVRKSFPNGYNQIPLSSLVPKKAYFDFLGVQPLKVFNEMYTAKQDRAVMKEELAKLFASSFSFTAADSIWYEAEYFRLRKEQDLLKNETVPRALFLFDKKPNSVVGSYSWNKNYVQNRNVEIQRLRRLARQGDAESIETLKNYEEFLQHVVKNKAYVALLEVGDRLKFDWSHVAYVLKMDKRSLLRQVEAEFIALLKNPEQLAKYQTSRQPDRYLRQANVDIEMFHRNGGNTEWASPEVNYLRLLEQWLKAPALSNNRDNITQNDVIANPKAYEARYAQILRSRFASIGSADVVTADTVAALHHSIEEKMFNIPFKDSQGRHSWSANLRQIQLRALMASALTEAQKQAWITALFFSDVKSVAGLGMPSNWKSDLSMRSPEMLLEIIDTAIRLKLYSSRLEFLESFKAQLAVADGERLDAKMASNKIYFRVLRSMMSKNPETWLKVPEKASVEERRQMLDRIVQLTFPPSTGLRMNEYSMGLVSLKKYIVDVVYANRDVVSDMMDVFHKLVMTGATVDTDRLFENTLKETVLMSVAQNLKLTLGGADTDVLVEHAIENTISTEEARELLTNKSISRLDLQVELLRVAIAEKVERLAANPARSSMDIFNLFKEVLTLAPDKSSHRDVLLEELAWTLDLKGRVNAGLVEQNRSTNWNTPENMSVPQWASAAVALLAYLSAEAKWELVDFVRNPYSGSGLDRFAQELRTLDNQVFLQNREILSLISKQDGYQTLAKYVATEYVISEIEKFAFSSNTFAKVPVINLILTGGKAPLTVNPQFMDFIYKRTNITKDSDYGRLLEALLFIMPVHERTITLSYLLATTKAGAKADPTELFKIARTVGIKFGQLSSIWNIFGEEVSRQTKNLKDNAGALTKFQIEQIIEKEVASVPALEGIKLIRILGSASVKTVVLIEMPSGEMAVLFVRNPNIKNQILTNIQMSHELINELEKRNVYKGSEFFRLLVNGMADQIIYEINFRQEMSNLMVLSQLTKRMNGQKEFKGSRWKFATITPWSADSYNSGIAVATLGTGKTFDKLSPETQKDVGKIIVSGMLDMFFKYGYMEPDRHKGNFFINEKTGVVTLLDGGQLTKYNRSLLLRSKDERATVAEFVVAIAKKEADQLIDAAMKMSGVSEISEEQRSQLRGKININFETNAKDQVQMLQTLVKDLAEHTLKLETKFSFGFIKGMMVLFGENYVSADEFTDLLEKKIKNFYRWRPHFYIHNAINYLKKLWPWSKKNPPAAAPPATAPPATVAPAAASGSQGRRCFGVHGK